MDKKSILFRELISSAICAALILISPGPSAWAAAGKITSVKVEIAQAGTSGGMAGGSLTTLANDFNGHLNLSAVTLPAVTLGQAAPAVTAQAPLIVEPSAQVLSPAAQDALERPGNGADTLAAAPVSEEAALLGQARAIKAAGRMKAPAMLVQTGVLRVLRDIFPSHGKDKTSAIKPADTIAAKLPSDGPPAHSGRILPLAQYVPITARKLRNARVLWINSDYLRGRGIATPAQGLTPELEADLLAAFAYGIRGRGEPDSAFLDQEKTFYADRYGGEGLGENLGSGRAASAGEFQLKGIGRTPLVRRYEDDHSNGLMSLEEAMREAFWGEKNQELPFGGNRVIAIIDRGTTVSSPDGKLQRNVIVVREDPVRPAHFMPLPDMYIDFSWLGLSGNKLARRLSEALPAPRSAAGKPASERIAAGLRNYAYRLALQYAAAFARKLFHGAPTASNIELSGRLLDYGTQTAIPGHGKLRVLSDQDPSGETGGIKLQQVESVATEIRKMIPRSMRNAVPAPEELGELFRAKYQTALRREFLLLTGVPPELLGRGITPSAKKLADLLINIATLGALDVPGKYSVPDRITRYDLGGLLTRLAASRSASAESVMAQVETQNVAAEDRLVMTSFAAAYAAFVSEALAAARADGVKPDALGTYLALSARARNRNIPEAYRWKMMDENFALIDQYPRQNDPALVQRAIDERIARARRIFRDLPPFQVVIRETRNAATGAARRIIYDAKRAQYFVWTGS